METHPGGIDIEPPQAITEEGATYLGCKQIRGPIKLASGQMAIAMTYDMEDFLASCVAKYVELAGVDAQLKAYPTPFIREEHHESPAGARGKGPCVECPFCKHTYPPPHTFPDVEALEVSKRKKQTGLGTQ